MQALAPGSRLGRFQLISPLGKGGMGEVWKAQDPRLSREVAIKILPPELANPDLKIRFDRECKILAALNHPNIAQIYEAGEEAPDGAAASGTRIQFLVMEFVEGRSLSQVLSTGPLPVLTVVRLGRQIARALGAAHKAGIIHRDLKPANIMVTSRNQVKVLDFGLARPTQRGPAGHAPTLPEVTASGMVLGTAAYLSPEQVKGEQADERSDIWALGCVLYQMLTGFRPFPGETIPEVLAAVLRDQPQPITQVNAGVPSPLTALVSKCLNKEANARPQSAFEIASNLKDLFHQIRPGGATPPAGGEAMESGPVQASLRNIENANLFLKTANPAYPQFRTDGRGPMAVEFNHLGARIGILFCTRQSDGRDILAFVCPLYPIPAANQPAFFKRLLSYSNGLTDVGQFAIDRATKTVNLVSLRVCDTLDSFQFVHTLNSLSDTASGIARGVRREFGIGQG